MSRTYKATGINLKSMPMGEADRLLTILTREFGLVRAVAMGSRKHNSRLGGRSELFVVNDLLIAKGRSLDKITQADTLESYPKLGQDLQKLVAGQYLAELCLNQALSDQPQEELFCLLNEHLARLERAPAHQVLAHLTHGIFQLLVLAGVAPQIYLCCMTRQAITPDLMDPNWRIGFSVAAGGTVTLAALEQLLASTPARRRPVTAKEASSGAVSGAPNRSPETFAYSAPTESRQRGQTELNIRLTAPELVVLQRLAEADLPEPTTLIPATPQRVGSPETVRVWQPIERLLRQYAQYYFDRPIRSAALVDACFADATYSVPRQL